MFHEDEVSRDKFLVSCTPTNWMSSNSSGVYFSQMTHVRAIKAVNTNILL